jgi:hypothetical protein
MGHLIFQSQGHEARVNAQCCCTALPHLKKAIQMKESCFLILLCCSWTYCVPLGQMPQEPGSYMKNRWFDCYSLFFWISTLK